MILETISTAMFVLDDLILLFREGSITSSLFIGVFIVYRLIYLCRHL